LAMRYTQDTRAWKVLVLALVIGLLGGVLGAALTASLFVKPGPQGEQGPQGDQGLQGAQGLQGVQGLQGLQGISGTNGTDSILQILQNRNDTQENIGSYTAMLWFNMSEFDSSMKITINIQQNSKIFAQFSSTQSLSAPSSMWVRINVDNNYNSSTYKCAIGPPSPGVFIVPGHIEFLTNSLNSGQHTIYVQFLRENGSPLVLDRTFTVMEIAND